MRFFLAPLTENLAVMGFLIFYMPKNADLLSNSGFTTHVENWNKFAIRLLGFFCGNLDNRFATNAITVMHDSSIW